MQEISLAYAAIKWNGRAIEKRCRLSSICAGYCPAALYRVRHKGRKNLPLNEIMDALPSSLGSRQLQ